MLITGISSFADKMAEKISPDVNVQNKESSQISPQDLRNALSSVTTDSKLVLNQGLIDMLKDMGFSEYAARRALYYTGGRGIEDAIEWLDVNADQPDLDAPFLPILQAVPTPQQKEVDTGYEADNEPDFKMLFVVNEELKMGVGKVAAQVAHATLGLYLKLQGSSVQNICNVTTWEVSGARKIVVGGKGTQELEAVQTIASSKNFPTFSVRDAGRTQVPSGSFTVLALFGSDDDLDAITGHLKLL